MYSACHMMRPNDMAIASHLRPAVWVLHGLSNPFCGISCYSPAAMFLRMRGLNSTYNCSTVRMGRLTAILAQ